MAFMDLVRCGHCGANLAPADLTQPACRFCGTVLPHHARAAQQAALVTNLLADRNQNGIPDAFEGLVASSMVQAAHVVSYHSSGGSGQQVVMTSASVSGAGLTHVQPHVVYPMMHQEVARQQQVVERGVRAVWIWVLLSALIALFVAVGLLALAFS